MKKFTTIILSFTIVAVFAQQTDKKVPTLREVQQNYYEQILGKDLNEVNGYKQFKRWEHFMEQRTYPSFKPFEPTALSKAYADYKAVYKNSGKSPNGNWSVIGPSVVPGNGGGVGRLNCIVLDPTNSNTIWVGAPDGGLWKSTDGGANWSTNTDLLPNIGVTDIAINHQNTDVMYIATGDGYGYDVGGEFWGGTYSNGVMKSSDGGATWSNSGLSWDVTQTRQIFVLAMSPTDPNVLLAGTTDGIYRTTDGGSNWTMVRNGETRDIKFKPNSGTVVYASDDEILKSINGGATWTQATTNLIGDWHALAVTPDNDQVVYAYSTSDRVYKSSNEAGSFTNTGTIANSTGTWYMNEIAVSPTDENEIFVSGLDVYKSSNSGATSTTVTDWIWPNGQYAHADTRAIIYHPTNSSTVYIGSDGGIFRSSNGGNTWTDLSDGITIQQQYRLGLSKTNQDLILAGAQDNGMNLRSTSGAWNVVLLADGMEGIIDPTDEDVMYLSWQFGGLRKSTDGGATSTTITPNHTGADWITVLQMDPSDNNTLYYGARELYKTTNGGISWTQVTNNETNFEEIIWISVSEADPDVIYISTGSKLYGGIVAMFRTDDGGANWTDVSAGLPTNSAFITHTEVDNDDPLHVWATFSGFSAGNKVFESTDGGANWTNISGSLPNLPVSCIEHDKEANNGLYIGTDMGVYYKNDNYSDWEPFMDGLPNVIVSELEIHFDSKLLRAATYGRGMWESDLFSPPVGENEIHADADLAIFPNPVNDVVTIRLNNSENWSYELFNVAGSKVLSGNATNMQQAIDISALAKGSYQLKVNAGGESYTDKVVKL